MLNQSSVRGVCSSSMIENLESRTFLSATPSAMGAGQHVEPAAIHAAIAKVSPATHTTLKVTAGTLGEAVTFDVIVKASAAAGSPVGTVALVSHGSVIQQLTLSPIASSNPKFALSEATYTLPAGAGGPSFSIGAHHVSAAFSSGNTLHKSGGGATFHVKAPIYARQSDGLKIATVGTGTGAAITAGQTATMMYTGYLAGNGKIFDYSSAHTPGAFTFTVEASPEQVIPGFDQGTLGMQAGETRVLAIPSKLGYGSTGAGSSIPPNANLVFLITLVSIS